MDASVDRSQQRFGAPAGVLRTTPGTRYSPDRIGAIVAAYRRFRGLKVSELARLVGVTPSLISQIEHGNSRPSVVTLFALAEALDVPVDAFARRSAEPPLLPDPPFPAAPPQAAVRRYVVRRAERMSIPIEGGVSWEMLTPTATNEFEFLELVYAPRAQSNPTHYRHPGSEMVLVLEGRFEIDVGFESYELEAGDSIYFPSTIPHRYANPTDAVARAVTVILRDAQAAREPPAQT